MQDVKKSNKGPDKGEAKTEEKRQADEKKKAVSSARGVLSSVLHLDIDCFFADASNARSSRGLATGSRK